MVEFLVVIIFILICMCIGLAISLKAGNPPIEDTRLQRIEKFLDNNSIGYDSNCTHSPSEALDHISYLLHGKSYHANSTKFDGDNTCSY